MQGQSFHLSVGRFAGLPIQQFLFRLEDISNTTEQARHASGVAV